MAKSKEVKNLVESAIRMLDEGSWHPCDGGQYKYNGIVVIFHRATRFQPKPFYTVFSDYLGKWQGNLNGCTGRNIGKPLQIYTPEQLQHDRDFNANSTQIIMDALKA